MLYGLISAGDHGGSGVSGEVGVISCESCCVLVASGEVGVLPSESSLLREGCNSTPSVEILLRKISTFISLMACTSTQAEYTGRNRLYSGGTCTYQCKYQGPYQDTGFGLGETTDSVCIDLFRRDSTHVHFME